MAVDEKEVLIFRTGLQPGDDLALLGSILNIGNVIRWTIDLEDCDSVLRLEVVGMGYKQVEEILNRQGIFCEELPD